MSKVGTIEREEIMDWAIRMMTGDLWNDDTKVVSVDIRHVSYENGGCSYLVVSDCEEKEIWFPIGPGIIGGIKNKSAKNEEREVVENESQNSVH